MPGVASCFFVKDASSCLHSCTARLRSLSLYHHGMTQTNPPPKLYITTSNTLPEVNSELFALSAALKIPKSHTEHALWWELLTKAHFLHWGSLEHCFGDLLVHFVRHKNRGERKNRWREVTWYPGFNLHFSRQIQWTNCFSVIKYLTDQTQIAWCAYTTYTASNTSLKSTITAFFAVRFPNGHVTHVI